MAVLQQGLDAAAQTQINNIQKKIGKSVDDVAALIAASGKTRHSDIRDWLGETFGLGAGDANTLAHVALKTDGASAAAGLDLDDILQGIYTGKKAGQRAIHDALMAEIERFGDFEIAPKKGYVSLKRKRQFAMLGPKTNDRFELGINLKDDVASPKIIAQKPGGMCQYAVALTAPTEIDAEILGVLRRAYDAAG